MSIEQTLERIAVALEKIAGINRVEVVETVSVPATETVQRKPRAKKVVEAPVDMVPGLRLEEPTTDPLAADEPTGPRTGAELRTVAQSYIVAADRIGMTEKLVTFIQSVAKIFVPAEPKLIKIPDAKVPEAAKMIADWCAKNGIVV